MISGVSWPRGRKRRREHCRDERGGNGTNAEGHQNRVSTERDDFVVLPAYAIRASGQNRVSNERDIFVVSPTYANRASRRYSRETRRMSSGPTFRSSSTNASAVL